MAPPVKYTSRLNTILRDYWPTSVSILIGMGTTIAGFLDPAFNAVFQAPALNTIAPAILGTVVGNGANALFNRYAARATSTVDQAYQEAVIWPHPHRESGYLVLQPRHHKHGWRHLADTIAWHKTPRLLGYTATLDQAQTLCHSVTHDEGQRVDPDTASPAWQSLLDQAYRRYQRNPTSWQKATDQALTGIWRDTSLSDTAHVAYRTRLTRQGRQIEFYPTPPHTMLSSQAVETALAQQALFTPNDRALPLSLPPGSPLTQAPDLHTAWDVQRLQTQATIPWTLLNVAKPDQMPYWTAGCAVPAPDGHTVTWHFFPEPPRTMTDPQRLSQDLRRYSVPDHTPAAPTLDVSPHPPSL